MYFISVQLATKPLENTVKATFHYHLVMKAVCI